MSQHRTIPRQSATTAIRLCQYGGAHCPPAVVFDIDGAWCSPQCQRFDRQSEITAWRQAVAA